MPAERVSRVDYVANMDAMVQLALQHGARCSSSGRCTAIARRTCRGTPHGLYRATLQEAMRMENIRSCGSTGSPGTARRATKELFGEHIHPSSNGRQLMAERILATLRERRMLRRSTRTPPPAREARVLDARTQAACSAVPDTRLASARRDAERGTHVRDRLVEMVPRIPSCRR